LVELVTIIPFRRKWPPWYQGWQWTLILALVLAIFSALILTPWYPDG
jgi:hypothetical protein